MLSADTALARWYRRRSAVHSGGCDMGDSFAGKSSGTALCASSRMAQITRMPEAQTELRRVSCWSFLVAGFDIDCAYGNVYSAFEGRATGS